MRNFYLLNRKVTNYSQNNTILQEFLSKCQKISELYELYNKNLLKFGHSLKAPPLILLSDRLRGCSSPEAY